MYRALELAAKAAGRTNPNPMVGAVIEKDGKIVGEGYHKKAGMSHAEVNAIEAAGDDARGATIYVTLEPCSHYGKTPPCVQAILKAGIKRVVAAVLDPNPRVAGNGMKILQDAGIDTKVGVLEDEARQLNEVFFKYITTKLPFVTLKVAMTLDGKIATYSRDSRWITGDKSREYVHHLRNTYDAIMVGIGTVLADDPQLNTRLDVDNKKDPIRIVIDGKLDIPLNSKIVATSREQKTIVFSSTIEDKEKADTLKKYGVEIVEIRGDPSKLPIDKILAILGEREICSLLVEGGAEINSYLIENKLIDKVHWFIAPKIIGGRNAASPVAGLGKEYMKDALYLNDVKIDTIDQDILITAYTGW